MNDSAKPSAPSDVAAPELGSRTAWRLAAGLARPFTLLAPMVGVVGGAFVAHGATAAPIQTLPLVAALTAAALATAASNAWNQVFDHLIDAVNKPERPIPAGHVEPGFALRFGHVCALLALASASFAGLAFFVCVLVGVAATWIYSAPPLRTKRRTFGALLTIAIPRGLLVPVAGWSVVAVPNGIEPWALGCVTGLYVLGAAVTKDFADIEGDAQHGCRTLPALLGPTRAAWIVAPFLVLPFALLPVLARAVPLTPATARLDLLAAVLAGVGLVVAFLLVRDPARLARRGENHPAWAGMYLLLLGTFIGLAIAYA